MNNKFNLFFGILNDKFLFPLLGLFSTVCPNRVCLSTTGNGDLIDIAADSDRAASLVNVGCTRVGHVRQMAINTQACM